MVFLNISNCCSDKEKNSATAFNWKLYIAEIFSLSEQRFEIFKKNPTLMEYPLLKCMHWRIYLYEEKTLSISFHKNLRSQLSICVKSTEDFPYITSYAYVNR